MCLIIQLIHYETRFDGIKQDMCSFHESIINIKSIVKENV
jgi:hypothetical protein